MTTPPTVPNPIRQSGEFLEYLYGVAVRRALPLHNTAAFLPAPPSRESGGRTLVLGAGKAGGAMAAAVDALWPAEAPLSGLVVTRYGHTPPRPAGVPQRIEVVEAAHPVPYAKYDLLATSLGVLAGVLPSTSPREKGCTVSMAVMQLELGDSPALMFRNAAHGRLIMVYRRPDGNVGWVDPGKGS